jgi:hypothetical protein
VRVSPQDWTKCTTDQKTKIWDLGKKKTKVYSTTVPFINTAVQQDTPRPTPSLLPAHTPHTVKTNETDFCHLIFNNTSM